MVDARSSLHPLSMGQLVLYRLSSSMVYGGLGHAINLVTSHKRAEALWICGVRQVVCKTPTLRGDRRRIREPTLLSPWAWNLLLFSVRKRRSAWSESAFFNYYGSAAGVARAYWLLSRAEKLRSDGSRKLYGSRFFGWRQLAALA